MSPEKGTTVFLSPRYGSHQAGVAQNVAFIVSDETELRADRERSAAGHRLSGTRNTGQHPQWT